MNQGPPFDFIKHSLLPLRPHLRIQWLWGLGLQCVNFRGHIHSIHKPGAGALTLMLLLFPTVQAACSCIFGVPRKTFRFDSLLVQLSRKAFQDVDFSFWNERYCPFIHWIHVIGLWQHCCALSWWNPRFQWGSSGPVFLSPPLQSRNVAPNHQSWLKGQLHNTLQQNKNGPGGRDCNARKKLMSTDGDKHIHLIDDEL